MSRWIRPFLAWSGVSARAGKRNPSIGFKKRPSNGALFFWGLSDCGLDCESRYQCIGPKASLALPTYGSPRRWGLTEKGAPMSRLVTEEVDRPACV